MPSTNGANGGIQASPLPTIPEGEEFIREWNALPARDRRRIRRLVKLGRPMDDPAEVGLAIAFSWFQQTRLWWRIFWLWFVPGLVLAMGIASRIHPLLVGAVIALSAQAVFTRRNVRRAQQVNASTLAGRPRRVRVVRAAKRPG